MKKNNLLVLMFVSLALLVTSGCVSRTNISTKGPGGFEHTDHSWSVNQPFAGGVVGERHYFFRGSIGGSSFVPAPYGYGNGGGYGYGGGQGGNVIIVPLDQRRFERQTMHRYGLDGDRDKRPDNRQPGHQGQPQPQQPPQGGHGQQGQPPRGGGGYGYDK
jgi:hypothetical protein